MLLAGLKTFAHALMQYVHLLCESKFFIIRFIIEWVHVRPDQLLYVSVTKFCVYISLQRGGGAIFNTVKTKANPAMKTVYKFVSTSLDSVGS